jgi:hypothetical protein
MSDIRTAAENRNSTRHSTKSGGKRAERPRSLRFVTAAALTVSLLLAGAVLLVGRLHSLPSDSLDHPANPVTDEQSEAQVIEPAKQIVTLTGLQTASAGYLLMSCKDRDDPPYQGAIYLTFTLPTGIRADTYLQTIASTLRSDGWTAGIPPNNHVFAEIFSKDAVTLTIYRDSDDPNHGALRLYGQCRNMDNHRNDKTTWIDITDQLKAS